MIFYINQTFLCSFYIIGSVRFECKMAKSEVKDPYFCAESRDKRQPWLCRYDGTFKKK
jgi:hypothetical protein